MIRTTILLSAALLATPALAGAVEIGRCDGQGTVTVDGLSEGQPLPRAEAQALATRLLSEWRATHPDRRWDLVAAAPRTDTQPGQPKAPPLGQPAAGAAPTHEATSPKAPGQPAAQAQGTAGPTQPSGGSGAATRQDVQLGHTYKNFTERDVRVWEAATKRFVDEGNQIFHDSKRLGGTTGISCDMCHPNASNTHPETYPKFQTQLGRVALLRDMVNWCILNPVRGKPLPDDDPRMKAIEAYIMSERKGVPMEYGMH
jgi:hypothetical protein